MIKYTLKGIILLTKGIKFLASKVPMYFSLPVLYSPQHRNELSHLYLHTRTNEIPGSQRRGYQEYYLPGFDAV
jgi:hypothetical protein